MAATHHEFTIWLGRQTRTIIHHTCVHMYVCVCVCVCVHIYAHTYRERDRERKSEGEHNLSPQNIPFWYKDYFVLKAIKILALIGIIL